MLYTDVFRIMRDLPALNKVSRAKLQTFSLEISLIALGLRPTQRCQYSSGYLFDTFSLSGNQLQVFCEIVQVLRQHSALEFEHVLVLYEPLTDGYFFINAPLLLKRCQDRLQLGISEDRVTPADHGRANLSAAFHSVIFVSISPTEAVLASSCPVRLGQLLSTLCDELDNYRSEGSEYPPSVAIPTREDISVADIIPLAAILIDYPVAYVPHSADQTSFLSGVELEVYSCTLVADTQDGTLPPRHTFMQFSCPKALLPDTGNMVDALREKFATRLVHTGLPCHLEVTSRTERLDRVAL